MLKKGSGFVYLHPVMVEDSGIVNTSLVIQANMNNNRVIATLGEQTLEIE